MKIIAVLNEKGGTGKSTVSTNLATSLHRAGKKVVLVDADPQGTARDWREASPEGADLPPVVALDRPQLLIGSLPTLAGNDYVVIDGPAKAGDMAAAIAAISGSPIVDNSLENTVQYRQMNVIHLPYFISKHIKHCLAIV